MGNTSLTFRQGQDLSFKAQSARKSITTRFSVVRRIFRPVSAGVRGTPEFTHGFDLIARGQRRRMADTVELDHFHVRLGSLREAIRKSPAISSSRTAASSPATSAASSRRGERHPLPAPHRVHQPHRGGPLRQPLPAARSGAVAADGGGAPCVGVRVYEVERGVGSRRFEFRYAFQLLCDCALGQLQVVGRLKIEPILR